MAYKPAARSGFWAVGKGVIHNAVFRSKPFLLCSSFYYLLNKLENLLISSTYRTLKGVNDCIKGCK